MIEITINLIYLSVDDLSDLSDLSGRVLNATNPFLLPPHPELVPVSYAIVSYAIIALRFRLHFHSINSAVHFSKAMTRRTHS